MHQPTTGICNLIVVLVRSMSTPQFMQINAWLSFANPVSPKIGLYGDEVRELVFNADFSNQFGGFWFICLIFIAVLFVFGGFFASSGIFVCWFVIFVIALCGLLAVYGLVVSPILFFCVYVGVVVVLLMASFAVSSRSGYFFTPVGVVGGFGLVFVGGAGTVVAILSVLGRASFHEAGFFEYSRRIGQLVIQKFIFFSEDILGFFPLFDAFFWSLFLVGLYLVLTAAVVDISLTARTCVFPIVELADMMSLKVATAELLGAGESMGFDRLVEILAMTNIEKWRFFRGRSYTTNWISRIRPPSDFPLAGGVVTDIAKGRGRGIGVAGGCQLLLATESPVESAVALKRYMVCLRGRVDWWPATVSAMEGCHGGARDFFKFLIRERGSHQPRIDHIVASSSLGEWMFRVELFDTRYCLQAHMRSGDIDYLSTLLRRFGAKEWYLEEIDQYYSKIVDLEERHFDLMLDDRHNIW